MKILFTSVGRRVELIQAFHDAAKKLGVQLDIVGVDISDTAPALYFCNVQKKICPIQSSDYISQLLKICKQEKIDCLIPTIDTDLLVLAENRGAFEKIGTKVFVAAPDKIKLCRNKNYTADYFISIGLNSPKPTNDVEKYTYGFPAFIKPKDGSSSINAYKVETRADLKVFANKIGDYVIQPFISGKEYTIDVFCDLEGNPIYITPRERIEIRAGEVLKTRICQNNQMIEEIKKLVADFKPIGGITVQLIRDEKERKNYYIEINPRFGGGAPLSMKAGADSAAATIKILQGEKLSYFPYAARNNEVYSRFDQSICVKQGGEDYA